jgi:cell division protein FtsL
MLADMRKKILTITLILALVVVAWYVYETYFSPYAVTQRVNDLNRWMECRRNFIDMYQKAGGNPYTMDGQLATDKWCGAKP